jgi:hypothetical protein
MSCCNSFGECARGCNCPAKEAGLIRPLRRSLSARVDKCITAALYVVSLAALISAVMLVGAVIGGIV